MSTPRDDAASERHLLGRTPKFQALLNRSKQSIREEKGLSDKDFWSAVEKRVPGQRMTDEEARA